MVKKVIQHFWEAEVELCILEEPGLAFSVQTDERKEKGRKVMRFRMDWLSDAGVMFDVGARLRGWFKMQAKTIRPSLGDIVSYGVRILSMPTPGMHPIAKVGELEGWKNPPTSITDDYKLPEEIEIAYPFKEAFSVGEGRMKRAIYAFHYELHRKVELKARIYSFARGLDSEQVEWILSELGHVNGIGDRYSRGYGLFELKKFNTLTKTEIPL